MFLALIEVLACFLSIVFFIHYVYFIVRVLTDEQMDLQYIKKRWKGGTIEPHPTEKALIVNYKLEAAVFSEPDDPMLEQKKNCQRIIRLKSLNARTNPANLAREVVNKCDLIHESQLSDVEQIIYYLKNRKDSEIMQDNKMTSSRSTEKLLSPTATATNNSDPAVVPVEKASIRVVDSYVELLYDELPDKIRGSSLILQLARNPDNLEELAKNEAVLNALARVLREDWKKSLDLSTNIVYIFFCFSTYSHFHPVIVQHKVGSLCMDVIEHELRRFDQMKAELEMRKGGGGPMTMTRSGSRSSITKSTDNLDLENEERPPEMEPPKRRIPELKQRPKSGNWANFQGAAASSTSAMSASMSSSLLKSRCMTSSYHEFLCNELDTKLSPESPKGDWERVAKQFKVFAKKQEQLLRVAFYLLLNIAENVKLEEKMRRKSVVRLLVRALERQNIDLLLLVVTFLKKLSIVRDNKDEMLALQAVDRLPRLLASSHADLVQGTLKLLFNLSFDGRLRAAMIRAGLLPRLVGFLNDDKHHGTALRILYHLSLDDDVKSMFTYSADCVALVTDMLLLNLSHKSDRDLVALAINLALNKRNAQIMVENSRLHTLMARAFKYGDVLLMKLLRNVSQHEALRPFFVDFVGDLAKILTVSGDEAFVVEAVGILGNLALPDLDYAQLLQNFGLVQWARDVLRTAAAEGGKGPRDDLVLEAIVFLGTCACDEACAVLLCRSDIVLGAIELLKAKQEDDEMVLQVVFLFQQVLRHESTRQYIIRETEAPAYLIDLMHDKNAEIRKVCDYCLDIVACTDAEWAGRIKLENFRNHNSQWLEMVETLQEDNQEDYAEGLEDADLEEFMPSEYLEHCKFYQSQDMDDMEEGEEQFSGKAGRRSRPISGTLEVDTEEVQKKREAVAVDLSAQSCDLLDNETLMLST